MLSLEMELIPQTPLSQPAEILELALSSGLEEVQDSPHPNVDDGFGGSAALVGARLLRIIGKLEGHGIRVKVPFGSNDWRGTNPFQELHLFETFSDYKLTVDILKQIGLLLPIR